MAEQIAFLGRLQPWDPRWRPDVQIKLIDTAARQDIGKPGVVDPSGYFSLALPASAELEKLLLAGAIAVAAYTRGDAIVGLKSVRPAKIAPVIAIRLPVFLLPPPRKAAAIVPSAAVHRLALQVASLQRVEVHKARAPKPVMNAIRQLNQSTHLAAQVASGQRDAMEKFRALLDANAVNSPGGAVGGFGITDTGVGLDFGDAGGLALPSRPCAATIDPVISVIDAGFSIDLAAGITNGYYVNQAGALLQSGLDTVASYARSVASDLAHGPVAIPVGEGDGLTEPIMSGGLPPGGAPLVGDGFPGGPGPVGGVGPIDGEGLPGLDFCQQLISLCMGIYQTNAAGSEGDTLLDLIGAVAPNCLCSSQFDPNRVYTATPADGRDFSVAITPATANAPAALRPDVNLWYGSQRIVPVSVSPRQIRFQLQNAQDFHTYFVYLRRIAASPPGFNQRVIDACGHVLPAIPANIPFDPSPKAVLSVIYPPVIDSFIASFNGNSGASINAEGCRDVVLRWHASLLDQDNPYALLPPCAKIDAVLVEDATGRAVPFAACPDGSGDDCATVNQPDDRTYTLTVTSRGDTVCGTASAQVTVTRTNYLALQYDAPQGQMDPSGQPINAGTNGTFDLVFSCPATQDFQVNLVSSDANTLQVPSPVAVRAGSQRVQVPFQTAAGACAGVTVSAPAPANNRPYAPKGPLAYDVYSPPVLRWAPGSPPAEIFEGVPFTAEVDTVCVPSDPQFGVNWSLTDPNGMVQALPANAVTATGANRFQFAFPGLSPANAAVPWQLNLAIRGRSNVTSLQSLQLFVLAGPTFRIQVNPTAQSIQWGNSVDFDVTVTPLGPFDGAVTLAPPLELTAAGASPQYQTPAGRPLSNNIVNLTPAAGGGPGPAQHATLRVTTSEGSTKLGLTSFTVIGTGRSAGLPPPAFRTTAQAALTVTRSTGAFAHVYVLPNATANSLGAVGSAPFTSVCTTGTTSPVSARYEINPSNQVTFFTGPDPTIGRPIGNPIPALWYLCSRKCRVGVVFAGLPPQTLQWYNLLFPTWPGVGVAPGNQIRNLGGGNWQQVWFSGDDSLLLVFSLVQMGSTSGAATFQAGLFNTLTGDLIHSQNFDALTVYPRMVLERAHAPNIILNPNQSSTLDPFGRDPTDPNNPDPMPGIAAPTIPDVYTAVLNPAGTPVTVTYRRYVPSGDASISQGQADTQNDLNNGTGNFRAFTLGVP